MDLHAEPYKCPKCPLTHSYIQMIEGVKGTKDQLKKGILDEMYRRYNRKPDGTIIKEWPFPKWPLKRCLTIFFHTYNILSENNFHINDKWDETTAELARIINSERTLFMLQLEYIPEQPKKKAPVKTNVIKAHSHGGKD